MTDSPAPTSPSEPLPCPWCGGFARTNKCGVHEIDYWLHCDEDDCSAQGPVRSSESEAISAWNRVASSQERAAEAQARVAELEMMLRRSLEDPMLFVNQDEGSWLIDISASRVPLVVPDDGTGLPLLDDAARAALRESRP